MAKERSCGERGREKVRGEGGCGGIRPREVGPSLLARMTHAQYQNLTFWYSACVILARTNGVLNAVSPGTTRREQRDGVCAPRKEHEGVAGVAVQGFRIRQVPA